MARFDPFTGQELTAAAIHHSPAADAGLEAPRFCELCGRRMVVRINPMGWEATCSRHGVLSSEELAQRPLLP